MSANRIVIVEDEEILRFGTTLHLKSFGYDIVGNFSSGEEAIEKVADLKPDIILMDIELAGEMSGIEAAKLIREKLDVPLIYLSVHSDSETIQKAESTHPFRYMNKPFHDEELKFTIEMAIKTHKMEINLLNKVKECQETLYNLPGVIYISCFEKKDINICNDMFEKITGFEYSELEQDDVHFMLPLVLEEDVEKLKIALRDAGTEPFTMNYRIKTKDNEIRYLKEIVNPVLGKEGFIYNHGIIFDVTD